MIAAALRTVPLFAELGDDDLERIARRSTTVKLSPNEELFAEGDEGESAFVIVEGAIEITKRTGERNVRLAIRVPGEVIGEMALLQQAPRSAAARAMAETELIAIPRAEIDELLATSAEAVRALFKVLLERWQSTQVLLAQSERMAQLGTLTAGLAHEMNNPAAAVSRSAGQLREAIDRLAAARSELSDQAVLDRLRQQVSARGETGRLDPIERADLETEVEDRLAAAGVSNAWQSASMLVDSGLADFIDEIVGDEASDPAAVLAALVADHEVSSLLHEVEEGTRRLSGIVRALKSYSYLDQGTVQTVDLVAGLEDTLLILRSKLEGIDVKREYHPDLPRIQARGGELNQVWTNLIDNAADAIAESGSEIIVRAFPHEDEVVVEVEDNGPGLSAEAQARAFDSFFTTKPPGAGTGLGLSISYGIVVDSHHGEITFDTRPGQTVFRVTLPTTLEE